LLSLREKQIYNKTIDQGGEKMYQKLLKFMGAGLLSVMVLAGCGADDTDGAEGNNDADGNGEAAAAENNNNNEENAANNGENNAADNNDNGNEEAAGELEEVKIGATQIVEHPSLDAAFEGFKSALADNGYVEGENVSYNFQSAQGDQNNANTIANNFVGDGVDMIFANSTPSSLAALNATGDIPIVFTSVTDAVGAGLVTALDEPGENITGVQDLHPEAIPMTVDFIETYFPDSTIGTIYNSGEQNSVAQIETLEEAIDGTSLSLVTRSVSTSAEVQQAADSLAGDIDVFYIVTDNTVVSALETVVATANDHDIPLVVGEPDSLGRGGFASYGIDYFTIGYRAGEMAAEILKGEKTTLDFPVEDPPEMQLMINKEAAEQQGVEWDGEWDSIAEFVESE
jgi:putative ABC transport system substrate-binding protein